MSSSHESKRILLEYHAPRLPTGLRQLSIDSSRVAGDVNVRYSAADSAAPVSTRVPQLPDDIQARLVQVGMRTRKSVTDGHRLNGSIPSYQPNFYSASVYDHSSSQDQNGTAQQRQLAPPQQQQLQARRYFSESDKFSRQQAGSLPSFVNSSARGHLKRTREEATPDHNDGDTDDDADDDDVGNSTLDDDSNPQNTNPSFQGSAATLSNSTYEPSSKGLRQLSAQQQLKANTVLDNDFEEAVFLDKSIR